MVEELESSIEQLNVIVTNRCIEQQIVVSPLETDTFITYFIGSESFPVPITIEKQLLDCPSQIELIVSCDGEVCPEETFFAVEKPT